MMDLAKLLAPIAGSNVCGEDLSFSREIDTIVEARRYDDQSLDQGEWVTEMKLANWPFVIDQCSVLIASKSKDLRLAVWLTEASAKSEHFRGLTQGYLLLANLCDQYWEYMYPLAEGDDQEQRIGNLYWILTRSIPLVKAMPITEGRGTAFSLLDFDAARARAANVDKLAGEGREPEGGLKLADLEAARRNSSRGFYEKLLKDVQSCLSALCQMERSVDARLGIDGPGFSAAKEAIENALTVIARFAQESGVLTNINPVSQDASLQRNDPSVSAPETLLQGSNSALQTRAHALAQLRSVADFFRRTEPHSPVAYLADKAAHWGEMSLHTWLSTVIKDPSSMAHVEELLGLKLPVDGSAH
ncbi:type VI secretion system protein TssA [soil metagenome]